MDNNNASKGSAPQGSSRNTNKAIPWDINNTLRNPAGSTRPKKASPPKGSAGPGKGSVPSRTPAPPKGRSQSTGDRPHVGVLPLPKGSELKTTAINTAINSAVLFAGIFVTQKVVFNTVPILVATGKSLGRTIGTVGGKVGGGVRRLVTSLPGIRGRRRATHGASTPGLQPNVVDQINQQPEPQPRLTDPLQANVMAYTDPLVEAETATEAAAEAATNVVNPIAVNPANLVQAAAVPLTAGFAVTRARFSPQGSADPSAPEPPQATPPAEPSGVDERSNPPVQETVEQTEARVASSPSEEPFQGPTEPSGQATPPIASSVVPERTTADSVEIINNLPAAPTDPITDPVDHKAAGHLLTGFHVGNEHHRLSVDLGLRCEKPESWSVTGLRRAIAPIVTWRIDITPEGFRRPTLSGPGLHWRLTLPWKDLHFTREAGWIRGISYHCEELTYHLEVLPEATAKELKIPSGLRLGIGAEVPNGSRLPLNLLREVLKIGRGSRVYGLLAADSTVTPAPTLVRSPPAESTTPSALTTTETTPMLRLSPSAGLRRKIWADLEGDLRLRFSLRPGRSPSEPFGAEPFGADFFETPYGPSDPGSWKSALRPLEAKVEGLSRQLQAMNASTVVGFDRVESNRLLGPLGAKALVATQLAHQEALLGGQRQAKLQVIHHLSKMIASYTCCDTSIGRNNPYEMQPGDVSRAEPYGAEPFGTGPFQALQSLLVPGVLGAKLVEGFLWSTDQLGSFLVYIVTYTYFGFGWSLIGGLAVGLLYIVILRIYRQEKQPLLSVLLRLSLFFLAPFYAFTFGIIAVHATYNLARRLPLNHKSLTLAGLFSLGSGLCSGSAVSKQLAEMEDLQRIGALCRSTVNAVFLLRAGVKVTQAGFVVIPKMRTPFAIAAVLLGVACVLTMTTALQYWILIDPPFFGPTTDPSQNSPLPQGSEGPGKGSEGPGKGSEGPGKGPSQSPSKNPSISIEDPVIDITPSP